MQHQGVSCPQHSNLICLPLNPLECEKVYDMVAGLRVSIETIRWEPQCRQSPPLPMDPPAPTPSYPYRHTVVHSMSCFFSKTSYERCGFSMGGGAAIASEHYLYITTSNLVVE